MTQPRILSKDEQTRFKRRVLSPYVLRGLFYRVDWDAAVNRLKVSSLSKFLPVLDNLRTAGVELGKNKLRVDRPDFEIPRQLREDGIVEIDSGDPATVLVLDVQAIREVLQGSPGRFGPARSKLAALKHFQPRGVIVSTGEEFEQRRKANDDVLEFGSTVHSEAARYRSIVQREVDRANAKLPDSLHWSPVDEMANRITLQVVLGEDRVDQRIADSLTEYRKESSILAPFATELNSTAVDLVGKAFRLDKAPFSELLKPHWDSPATGSLMGILKQTAAQPGNTLAEPDLLGQVPQWLFAMTEGIGLHMLNTLALLVAHPADMRRARAEAEAMEGLGAMPSVSFLEQCIQETMRLWTAVPFLFREALQDTTLTAGQRTVDIKQGTQVLVLSAFSNRDDALLSDPDRFIPARWKLANNGELAINGQAQRSSTHFSFGPQTCAGKHLALFLMRETLACLLRAHEYVDVTPRLPSDQPMPTSYDPFDVRLTRRDPMPEPASRKGSDPDYDYIVVGSGAGGGPVAANLAWQGHRVLVLEAGRDYQEFGESTRAHYEVPAFHALASEDDNLSWDFHVDRVDSDSPGRFYPRAATVGGCGAHNAMICVRAPDADWQRIADETGDPSWRPDAMDGHLRKLERCLYDDDATQSGSTHGHDGWLGLDLVDPDVVIETLGSSTLRNMILAAARTVGERTGRRPISSIVPIRRSIRRVLDRIIPSSEAAKPVRDLIGRDINSPERPIEEGLYMVPLSTASRRRDGPREYLQRTAGLRPNNLEIRTGALVTEVLFEDGAGGAGKPVASGVRYLVDEPYDVDGVTQPAEFSRSRDGFEIHGLHDVENLEAGPERMRKTVEQVRGMGRTITAREVIVCGGTFATPQLLMLSGIGDPTAIEKLGIESRSSLMSVGKNLQDRYEVSVIAELEQEHDLLQEATFGIDDPQYQRWTQGTGPYVGSGALVAILRRSVAAESDHPDLFIFGSPTEFGGYVKGYSNKIAQSKNHFSWVILKSHTRNQAGTVSLDPANPFSNPVVDFKNFQQGADADTNAITEAIRLCRKIMDQSVVDRSLRQELVPGKENLSDAHLAEFIQAQAWGHHACGTCRMGRADDPAAVVDSQFRVRGVDGLRVVDASVFPNIPGYFIVLPLYMIAQKASEIIGRPSDPAGSA